MIVLPIHCVNEGSVLDFMVARCLA